ncbi:dihydrofolate reductase [Clostridium tarantellae]|uniref:Dihydrofolate reductase n=1 Tax=Clostridium tarantellae TaxID=39493 RepID=A0A6I1MQI6_9CLOT|nr:dihydrofolate reductase [Clostridium tarantellae]MPQ44512.1 dihydrofolate reductase [Clostridium tarantellae]
MFSIIVALDNNNLIGKNNSLIWHIPDDLKRFKEITNGHKIIMGRKTFESLPKVLPNRKHIIITRNKNFNIIHDDVEILNDIQPLINKYYKCKEEIFIIGGGEIYSLFLPYAKKLYITKILNEFNGDVYFPKINISQWMNIYSSKIMYYNELKFIYKTYKKL